MYEKFFISAKNARNYVSMNGNIPNCEIIHIIQLKSFIFVNNIGKVYHHNNLEVSHSIVVYVEDIYHKYL